MDGVKQHGRVNDNLRIRNPFEHIHFEHTHGIMLPDVALTLRSIDGLL